MKCWPEILIGVAVVVVFLIFAAGGCRIRISVSSTPIPAVEEK